jgi:hypothetical protein
MRFSAAFLTAAMLAGAALARTHAAGMSSPTVTGPIAASLRAGDPAHDYPFYASIVDLAGKGYVEQEYFIEGTANRYETPADATGRVADGGHPYKTRIVVRRPKDAARFNGTVILEWNNVTAGHDLDIDWFQSHDHFIRAGYAWIGVTPQRIGVEALKVWNAKRYGSLDVTAGGTISNDALSYDIFAAAAQAVRTPGAVNIMGGFRIDRIFATGHSQSASRLATYVNAVHPLAPIFDAVVVHGGGGKIRTDLDVKVWKLLSETDVLGQQAATRQPDTKNFRTWEVAGDSHVDVQFRSYSRQLTDRDGGPVAPGFSAGLGGRGAAAPATAAAAPAAPPPANMGAGASPCERPPYSHVPFHQVMNAAFDHLVRWVKDGTLPPAAPPIAVSSEGPPAIAVRDKAGNALGGIRLAEHAVPTGVNTGVNTGPGFCRLYGSHEDFDATTLKTLYPTHAAYVAAVKDVTEKNVKAGYILKVDGDMTIAGAERSTIGK